MSKHTSGPRSKSERIGGAIAKFRDPLAICFADTQGDIVWMNDYDYTLAVSAPEIFEALCNLVDDVSEAFPALGALQEAKAAIAKARGES